MYNTIGMTLPDIFIEGEEVEQTGGVKTTFWITVLVQEWYIINQ